MHTPACRLQSEANDWRQASGMQVHSCGRLASRAGLAVGSLRVGARLAVSLTPTQVAGRGGEDSDGWYLTLAQPQTSGVPTGCDQLPGRAG